MSNTKIYGIRWDMKSPETKLERTMDAAALPDPRPAINGLGGSSPFDHISPWCGIRECNVRGGAIVAIDGDAEFTRDGSNGDVMVYFPAVHLKTFVEDGRYLNIQIASGEAEGFIRIAGRFCFCLGKYETSQTPNGQHVSVPAMFPAVSKTRAQFREAASDKGTHWSQQDAAARFALALLYLVEYADWNSQAALGRGRVDMPWSAGAAKTGGTDGMKYHTGCAKGTNGKTAIAYRGVENPWGNVWEFVDGINFKDGRPYICTAQEHFNDDTTDRYEAAAYACPDDYGWQRELGVDENMPWLLLPVDVSGNENEYIPDYFFGWNGWRVLVVGGRWYRASRCGVFCWYANNASSYANASFGSRLLFLPC